MAKFIGTSGSAVDVHPANGKTFAFLEVVEMLHAGGWAGVVVFPLSNPGMVLAVCEDSEFGEASGLGFNEIATSMYRAMVASFPELTATVESRGLPRPTTGAIWGPAVLMTTGEAGTSETTK